MEGGSSWKEFAIQASVATAGGGLLSCGWDKQSKGSETPDKPVASQCKLSHWQTKGFFLLFLPTSTLLTPESHHRCLVTIKTSNVAENWSFPAATFRWSKRKHYKENDLHDKAWQKTALSFSAAVVCIIWVCAEVNSLSLPVLAIRQAFYQTTVTKKKQYVFMFVAHQE